MAKAATEGAIPGLEKVSSQGLIRLLIAVLLLLMLSASTILLISARAQDGALLDEIEQRLLLVLEKGGLSGLAVSTATYDRALLPPSDVVEFAIWRRVGDNRILLAETVPGLSDALPDNTVTGIDLAGQAYVIRWPDVAAASRDWDVSYSDVDLGIALRAPTSQMKMARRMIGAICGMGLLFLLGMVLINLNHQRRYARGLVAINETLDAFARGQTDMRVSETPVAPEIDRLAGLLNGALSRIDQLTNGLRYMSAHLAHEINTPLQKIRAVTSRLAAQSDRDDRTESAAEIDRILETAGARQQNLMQLFRLEAGEVTKLDDRINLGAVLEEIYEDFEDVLKHKERQVTLDLAAYVEIVGNRPLLELLLTNLLTNAGKYAVTGSHIRIVLSKTTEQFCLKVSNDGSVFPDAVRAAAFRRFVRADDGGGPGGAGLGLNLVFAICQAHGFGVALPSDPDKAIIEVTGNLSPPSGAAP
ncbi:sensor histidine kinase [Roseobacter sp. A03A-229]